MKLFSSHFRTINWHVCYADWFGWLNSLVRRGTWPSSSCKSDAVAASRLTPCASRTVSAVRKNELIASTCWVVSATCGKVVAVQPARYRSQTHAMGQDEDLEKLMGHLGQYQTLHFFITILVILISKIVSIFIPRSVSHLSLQKYRLVLKFTL